YCQDNELTWLDWSLDESAQNMLISTKRLLRIRRDFLANQSSSYPARGETSYLHWYNTAGEPMTVDQWRDPAQRVVTVRFGSAGGLLDGLVVINGSSQDIDVTMPHAEDPRSFELRMSTADVVPPAKGLQWESGSTATVPGLSISIFRSEGLDRK
nr:glycogen debranching enzyme GlgX [Acidobacteriota bacterium]